MQIVKKEPRTKQRRITLYKNDIMEEIDRLSYKLAETSVGGEAGDNISTDSEDSLDAKVLDDLMDVRDSIIRKRLSFCLQQETIYEISNRDEAEHEYIFDVILPESFPDKDLKTAVHLMHSYYVKATLMDWYDKIGTAYGGSMALEVMQLESKIVDIFRRPTFVGHPSIILQTNYFRR